MQNLKLILILNTSSNEVCEYYPRNTSLEFLDETKTLMSSFKGGFTQGSVQTKENIYYYYTFLPKKNDLITENDDHCFIVLVTSIGYDEKLIKKFYSTLKSQLNETSYSNYKLSKEARHLLIKLFLSYQKDNINDINNTLSEIEPTEDFNSFNYNYLSNKDEQTVDYNKESTNKIKGYSTLDDEHIFSDKNPYGIKDKNEIAKILYWRKAKIVLTLIFVTLVIVSFISIPILFKRISKN